MQEYHEKFKGRVMMTKILNGANTSFDQLPVLQEFWNPTTKKNELCYNHVMGVCSNRRCWYKHAARTQITNSFAGDLQQLCGPGIDFVVWNEPAIGNLGWTEGGRPNNGQYGRMTVGSGASRGAYGGGNHTAEAEGGSDGKREMKEAATRYDSPGKQQRRA
jgi:hypothetical protein